PVAVVARESRAGEGDQGDHQQRRADDPCEALSHLVLSSCLDHVFARSFRLSNGARKPPDTAFPADSWRYQDRSLAPKRRSRASTTRRRRAAASSSVSVRSADWKATEKAIDFFPSGIGGPR